MIRLLLLFLIVAIFPSEEIPLNEEENDENDKFRTLKTDIQLSASETQELLEILKGNPTSNSKKMDNDPEPIKVAPGAIGPPKAEIPAFQPGIFVEEEVKEFPTIDAIQELMEPVFTTINPISTARTPENDEISSKPTVEPKNSPNPSCKKLKLRKIAVNTKESHFFKLRSGEFGKVKKRLIKDQLGEDFDEILKSLKEEEKNGTKKEGNVKGKKEKKAIFSKEINATVHTPAERILPPLLRKPLPISPILDKEPLQSLIVIRNGRVFPLSRGQQQEMDAYLWWEHVSLKNIVVSGP